MGDHTTTLRQLRELADAPEPPSESGRIDRLTAHYMLAVAYGEIDSEVVGLAPPLDGEDRFAIERASDRCCRDYLEGALPLFPRVPVVVRDALSRDFIRPEEDGFVLDLVRARHRLLRHETYVSEVDRTRRVLRNLEWRGRMADDPVNWIGRRLLLDARGEAALHATLYDLALRLAPDAAWRCSQLVHLADEQRALLTLDESARRLAEARPLATGAEAQRSIEEGIALDRRIAGVLERAPEIAEFLLLDGLTDPEGAADRWRRCSPWQRASQLAKLRQFPPDGRRVRSQRNGPQQGYLFVGDHPTWSLQQDFFTVGSGPRTTDRLRCDEIRFHDRRGALDHLLVVDGREASDLSLRFTIDFAVPPDFRTVQEQAPVAGRPAVGVLFGARDLDCQRPLRAHALLLDERSLSLVSLRETGRVSGTGVLDEARTLERTPIESRPGAPHDRVALSVRIAGDGIDVRVGDRAERFPAPEDRRGFYGLLLRGVGYAAVRDLTVENLP